MESSQQFTRRDAMAASLAWLPFWRPSRKRMVGIEFRVIRGRSGGRRFLRIHGSETTAGEVLAAFAPKARGVAYIIENSKRNILVAGGEIDPNRMFSRVGADANLRNLNPTWNEARIMNALIYLDRHRHQLIDAVRPRNGDILVVMHNNGPGYSVNDETPISDEVALNDASNPHEFCLCTNTADFQLLRRGAYNVVLQNRAPREDDGSLSRLAAREGWRYVNIEAGLGKAEKQRAMLEWLDRTLPPSPAG